MPQINSQFVHRAVWAALALMCLAPFCASAQSKKPLPGEERPAFTFRGMAEIPYPHYDNPNPRARGPFRRLVLRGAMMIDGTGAPVQGPVDIVVAGNRIAEIVPVGHQGVLNADDTRPDSGDLDIDAHGMYVLPGFINSHAHLGPASVPHYNMAYIYKLWLAHGITTVRDVGSFRGLRWTASQANDVAAGRIEGPQIHPYAWFGGGVANESDADTREIENWVRRVKDAGAKGIKFHSGRADAVEAAIRSAAAQDLRTTMHHAQIFTPQATVLDTARWGLESMEHFWYGLPEALFSDRRIQDYPVEHNYSDEMHRFQGAARIWAQAAAPKSDLWNSVMDELVALKFTISPTFAVKSATLDVMAARRADWHEAYTAPWQWDFFKPSREVHGSFWFDWTSRDEAAASEDYRLGMAFVNEFKNRGGRVVVGEDAGYALCLYGFCYVRELMFLQEAGFSALEIFRSATLYGAQLLGISDQTGTIRVGNEADLVVVDGNPLHNLKVLLGTRPIRLNDKTGKLERYGGVAWTVSDGRVYDARELLEDVREMVRREKVATGFPDGIPKWVDY